VEMMGKKGGNDGISVQIEQINTYKVSAAGIMV
jgi:hypothetical protein